MNPTIQSFIKTSVAALPFKKQLFTGVRLLNPPQRVAYYLRFKGNFKVPLGRKSFLMRSNGLNAENRFFWRGIFAGSTEEQPLRLWMKHCEKAEVIFDIGANLGIYSLVAKAVNPQAKVYGFEPVKNIYEKYKTNCEINDFDIVCVNAAAADKTGEAQIHINPRGIMTASLNASKSRVLSETVRTIRLCDFIHENHIEGLDLMKIDVEGFEPQVLEGLGDALQKFKPAIIIEILSDAAGKRVEEIMSGYRYFNIDERRGAVPADNLSIIGKSRHSRNFLLTAA